MMPLTSRSSPVKPLGESSGNAVMSPQQRGRPRNVVDGPKIHEPKADTDVQHADDKTNSRRTRSSKYLKSLLDKPKSKPESSKQEGVKGHKRAQSAVTSYSVFPKVSAPGVQAHQPQDAPDKENARPPPIWSQFATVPEPPSGVKIPLNDRFDATEEALRYTPKEYSPSKQRSYAPNEQPTLGRRTQALGRPRPKSENLTASISQSSFVDTLAALRHSRRSQDYSQHSDQRRNSHVGEAPMAVVQSPQLSELTVNKRGSRVRAAVAAFNTKSKREEPDVQVQTQPQSQTLDPTRVNQAFESMLV